MDRKKNKCCNVGKLSDKEELCDALYNFSGHSDSSQEIDELAVLLKQARKRNSPDRTLSRSPGRERSNTLPDHHSLKRQKETDAQYIVNTMGSDKSTSARSAFPKRRSTADDAAGKPSMSRRRREPAIRVRPEHQQIFRGMVFFFIPNDDISPARRMRINKALEFGASRSPTWSDTVTHVIADKMISFTDVLKYLKLDSFPPSVSLVNESYPSECINCGSLLSGSHVRFRVRGVPVDDREIIKSIEAPVVRDSPTVKPVRSGNYLETPTPSRSPPIGEEFHGPPVPSLFSESHRKDDCDGAVEQLSHTGPDILDEMIKQTRVEKELPLDQSDEEDLDTASNIEEAHSNSDSETEKRKKARKKKRSHEIPKWQETFSCMHKHDGHTDENNPNAQTIEILQKMSDYYDRVSDEWRALAYRKAISILRKQKEKIVTKEQALAMPFIGERLAAKIEEIVWTNRLRRLEEASTEPHDVLLSQFLNIYGVGFTQASKWIQQGYQSLEDLNARACLTKNQRIGIEHYDDFLQRIPRAEVEAHGAIVKELLFKVDPAVKVIIGGSYRRGAASSGDIDLIITKDGASQSDICALMTDVVIPALFQQNYLQASLAVGNRGESSKWHGTCALPRSKSPVWRRIDFLYVPGDEIGAALIYFTGNDVFNRSLRLLASKKGMCLNQRGLFAGILRRENRVKLNRGHLLESRDEKRIFEILGVPWRPPNHRIC
ncbi:polymerase [Histoplasma capsulatum var. duboisii H88]|uniref:DNA polymerase lambda n=2 Tax=Ajellomyces capsulatus TaxID=5037 RepID=F0UB08_AJEC8|nr:polymerase [Histoplasma capsulatum H143]EGC42971.1 polymerase [Histoplasma capsulatum var. duboisii H88]